FMIPALRRAESNPARAMRRGRGALACGWVALACVGCDPEPSTAPASSTSASAQVTPAASSSASARHYLKRPKAAETPSCRVMGVEGPLHVAHSEKLLKVGDLVDSEAWLDLGEAGRLSLKHTQTGREWTVRGPAWLRACIDGQESVWLSAGELSIGTGAGVRPGAQVVISTPHGSVRWGDAALSVKVSPKQTAVSVSAGRAWLTPTLQTKLSGDAELGAKGSAKRVAEGSVDKRTQLVVEAGQAG